MTYEDGSPEAVLYEDVTPEAVLNQRSSLSPGARGRG